MYIYDTRLWSSKRYEYKLPSSRAHVDERCVGCIATCYADSYVNTKPCLSDAVCFVTYDWTSP